MRPVVIKQTNIGITAAVPLDQYLNPFQVTLACIISGAPTYQAEYTYDDVFNVAAGNQTWWVMSDVPAGTVGNAEATLDNPVKAVRLNVTAVGAPTDSVTMTVNQSGAR